MRETNAETDIDDAYAAVHDNDHGVADDVNGTHDGASDRDVDDQHIYDTALSSQMGTNGSFATITDTDGNHSPQVAAGDGAVINQAEAMQCRVAETTMRERIMQIRAGAPASAPAVAWTHQAGPQSGSALILHQPPQHHHAMQFPRVPSGPLPMTSHRPHSRLPSVLSAPGLREHRLPSDDNREQLAGQNPIDLSRADNAGDIRHQQHVYAGTLVTRVMSGLRIAGPAIANHSSAKVAPAPVPSTAAAGVVSFRPLVSSQVHLEPSYEVAASDDDAVPKHEPVTIAMQLALAPVMQRDPMQRQKDSDSPVWQVGSEMDLLQEAHCGGTGTAAEREECTRNPNTDSTGSNTNQGAGLRVLQQVCAGSLPGHYDCSSSHRAGIDASRQGQDSSIAFGVSATPALTHDSGSCSLDFTAVRRRLSASAPALVSPASTSSITTANSSFGPLTLHQQMANSRIPRTLQYRRSSSKHIVNRVAGHNAYRQLPGVSMLADNALASFVNIIVKLHGANQPGGLLYKYRTNKAIKNSAMWSSFNGGSGFRVCMGFGLHIGWVPSAHPSRSTPRTCLRQ